MYVQMTVIMRCSEITGSLFLYCKRKHILDALYMRVMQPLASVNVGLMIEMLLCNIYKILTIVLIKALDLCKIISHKSLSMDVLN